MDCLESLALNGNSVFCYWNIRSCKQNNSSLCSLLARILTRLASCGGFSPPTHSLLYKTKSGRRGFLDLFALNVSTDFLFVYLSYTSKKTPSHFAHKSLEPWQNFVLWFSPRVNLCPTIIKKADEGARTLDVNLGKVAFYHWITSAYNHYTANISGVYKFS